MGLSGRRIVLLASPSSELDLAPERILILDALAEAGAEVVPLVAKDSSIDPVAEECDALLVLAEDRDEAEALERHDQLLADISARGVPTALWSWAAALGSKAGIVAEHRVAAPRELWADLERAGAEPEDAQAIHDRTLITGSGARGSAEAFCRLLVEEFASATAHTEPELAAARS